MTHSAGQAAVRINNAGFTSLMHLVVEVRPLSFTATLPGGPESIAIARQLTRDVLSGCPRTDDLLLAISELVSNAIIHTASGQGGTLTARVRTAPRWARVEITDQGPTETPSQARNGWGLAIVAGVTDRTGTDNRPNGHRTTWAEVTWPA